MGAVMVPVADWGLILILGSKRVFFVTVCDNPLLALFGPNNGCLSLVFCRFQAAFFC